LLETQEKLNEYGHRFLADQFRNLWIAYLRRLGGPLVVAAALISLYLLFSRLVLPRRFQKEELFLARRLGRYATALLVAVIAAMYLIEDIAALATTLGLVSAALVISLQDVCASFFAWFVIMLGHKFTIGDRLEIDGTKGDVLDIQLLRTTLIELNNWLGTDQPTGRIIVIPNNLVFKTKVFNYSHVHPFIWGKIEVTVTYSTPVAEALALFRKVLEEETRQDFAAARKAAATMERRYGVADAEYEPKIHTKLADSGVTLSLFYVSNYRQTSAVRNRLNRRLIAELENHREIQLAYTTMSVLTSQASAGPSAVLGSETDQPPAAAARV
jgi:small-conductance mechanosensitive channel